MFPAAGALCLDIWPLNRDFCNGFRAAMMSENEGRNFGSLQHVQNSRRLGDDTLSILRRPNMVIIIHVYMYAREKNHKIYAALFYKTQN